MNNKPTDTSRYVTKLVDHYYSIKEHEKFTFFWETKSPFSQWHKSPFSATTLMIEGIGDLYKAQVKYFIQSKTGIDINDMSHYTKVVGENQAEILFKSGTKFRIESVEKNIEGIFEIVMREF